MKKQEYIVLAVILAVFTVIALAAPFAKNTVFWLAYAFGALAVLFQLYILKLSGLHDQAASRYYGYSIARVGLVYLVAQLILSLVEMALAVTCKPWLALVLNILPLAYAVIGCAAVDAVKDVNTRLDEQVKAKTDNLYQMHLLTESMVNTAKDEHSREELKKLAEAFRYSDPVSSEKTQDLEKNINEKLQDLQAKVSVNDMDIDPLIAELVNMLNERNRMIQMNK